MMVMTVMTVMMMMMVMMMRRIGIDDDIDEDTDDIDDDVGDYWPHVYVGIPKHGTCSISVIRTSTRVCVCVRERGCPAKATLGNTKGSVKCVACLACPRACQPAVMPNKESSQSDGRNDVGLVVRRHFYHSKNRH